MLSPCNGSLRIDWTGKHARPEHAHRVGVWASAIFGLPLVLLAGLVAAFAGRGSVRMQLLIMAAIPVALYVAITGGVGH